MVGGFSGGYCDYGGGCWPVLWWLAGVVVGLLGGGWVFFLGAMAGFVWCRGGLVVVVVVGWMRFL